MTHERIFHVVLKEEETQQAGSNKLGHLFLLAYRLAVKKRKRVSGWKKKE